MPPSGTVIGVVDVGPLVDVLKKLPQARVQMNNSAGPLLGKIRGTLIQETQVTFDIATVGGSGEFAQLLKSQNHSYEGSIPFTRSIPQREGLRS